jgi:hypothetical protein
MEISSSFERDLMHLKVSLPAIREAFNKQQGDEKILVWVSRARGHYGSAVLFDVQYKFKSKNHMSLQLEGMEWQGVTP